MKKLFLSLLLICLATPAFAQNALSNLADSMSVGDWRLLTTNGRTLTSGDGTYEVVGHTINVPNDGAGQGLLDYASNLMYNPNTGTAGRVYLYGESHVMGISEQYCRSQFISTTFNVVTCGLWGAFFIQYDIANNRFDFVRDHLNQRNVGDKDDEENHIDQAQTINPATGDIYVNPKGINYGGAKDGNDIRKYTLISNAWNVSTISCAASASSLNIFALGWFPENNGMIIPVTNSNTILFYGLNTQNCVPVLTMAEQHYFPVAIYNSFSHDMFVGSGGTVGDVAPFVNSRTFYIIRNNAGTWSFKRPNGTFTTGAIGAQRFIPNVLQCGFQIPAQVDSANNAGELIANPTNGHYFMFGYDAGCARRMYDYDPDADTWTQVNTTIPLGLLYPTLSAPNNSSAGGMPGIAIPNVSATSSVLMFWNEFPADQGSNVWLYKYAGTTGTSDLTPPTQPSNFRNTALTATSAEFMWTASTDNVGVTGYNVSRCVGVGCSSIITNFVNVGSTNVPIFNLTGLTPATSYSFRVHALDAAGNQSVPSTVVTVVTSSQTYTFTQKCALAGVLNCIDFESPLRYHLATPADGAGFNDTCVTQYGGTITSLPYSVAYANYANTKTSEHNGNCIVPVLDTSIKHSGNSSIKFTVPTHSSPDTSGEFREPFHKQTSGVNFDGIFSYVGPTTTTPDTTAVHAGNTLWVQFYQRFTPEFYGTLYDAYKTVYFGLTTSSAGTTTVNIPGCVGTPTDVGRHLWISAGSPNFLLNTQFSIIAMASDHCTMTLNLTPSPAGPAGATNGGFAFVDNVPGTQRASGQKQMGIFPNPDPTGLFRWGAECCRGAFQPFYNEGQIGVPTQYGYDVSGGVIELYPQSPQDAWPQYVRGCSFSVHGYNNSEYPLDARCKPYMPNVWHEFTIMVTPGTNGAFNSILKAWVDGQETQDITDFQTQFGGLVNTTNNAGNGFGSFDIAPYHSAKDPNQDHPVAYTWYDDIIISTQPIPMLSASGGGGGDPNPPMVLLTAPSNGATISGFSTLTATASDDVFLQDVHFTIDGTAVGTFLVSTPFALTLNLAGIHAGSHAVCAVARDSSLNTASSCVTVTVNPRRNPIRRVLGR